MRCKWVNLENPLYVKYHDEEWGVESHNDAYLFEMLVLESFQAGLSWECILNKRESFREAFDNFDYKKIALYEDKKIQELMNNKDIIRNHLKVNSTIKNAKIFMDIQDECGSFDNYIWSFTDRKKIISNGKMTTSEISDMISKDLYKRGMRFVGSTIIYSYLQAIGIIYDHDANCDLYKE